MDKHIDARDLPMDLDRVMDEAIRDNTRTIVDRDGTPTVVIMSVTDYLSVAPAADWLEESWRRAAALGMDAMTMDEIDAEIAAARAERRAAAAQKD